MSDFSTVVIRNATAQIGLGDELLGGVIAGASDQDLIADFERLESDLARKVEKQRTEDMYQWRRVSILRHAANSNKENDRLRVLLSRALPFIRAQAGASHLLEGFRPRRNSMDELVEDIDAAMQEKSE